MSAQAPQPLELVRETDALRLRARVPRDLACFDGHFPGHPVLPGLFQLHWVLTLAEQELGLADPPCALEALKFRRLLLPGDEFSLRVERGAAGLRFQFEALPEGAASASGRVRLDAALLGHEAEPAPSPPDASAAPPLRIPQQGAMRLLERVLAHAPPVTLCEALVRETTPLVAAGRAPAFLALELLAQGMAAQGALATELSPDRRAFLAGARRLELRTRHFTVGERLWVRVRHQRGETGFVVADCTLGVGADPGSDEEAARRALASGALTAYVEAERGDDQSATR